MSFDKLNLGQLLEKRAAVGAEIKKMNAELKELKEEQMDLDSAIMQRADGANLSRVSNDFYTASVTEEEFPQVLDWDQFYEYILKNRDFSLLQRRPSSTAYREAVKLEGNIPGVETRTIRKISFRKNT